jgi:hypothetical protein
MSGQPELPFSNYIVFIDESSDPGLVNVDPNYPKTLGAGPYALEQETEGLPEQIVGEAE